MKLIYQGFKITPELRNAAKSLAAAEGVNFSEWLARAVENEVFRSKEKGVENEKSEKSEKALF